jgi:uncharacterized membrane protein YidH (DUF202 family)
MLSAGVLGVLFGFVAQRTGFCGAALISSVVLSKETKGVLAVLIAVLLTMLGFAFFSQQDWIVANPTPLRLMPAIVGGVLFGIGMVLGGGCVAGSLYKAGEGRISSMLAVIGIVIGAQTVRRGCLASAKHALEGSTSGLPILGGLHQIVGGSYSVVAGSLSVTGLLAVVFFARRAVVRGERLAGFSARRLARGEWPLVAGAILVGLLEWVAALSSAVHGRNYGIGVLGGLTSLFATLTGAGRASDPWDMWFVVGIPMGATISAVMRRKLQLRSHEPSVLIVCFLGGLLMGAGAILGRGCFLGNTVTGLGLLSIHSAVFTGCTVLANWVTTVCYLRGLR